MTWTALARTIELGRDKALFLHHSERHVCTRKGRTESLAS